MKTKTFVMLLSSLILIAVVLFLLLPKETFAPPAKKVFVEICVLPIIVHMFLNTIFLGGSFVAGLYMRITIDAKNWQHASICVISAVIVGLLYFLLLPRVFSLIHFQSVLSSQGWGICGASAFIIGHIVGAAITSD